MTWLLDLDGVVWLTGQPIDGAPEAIDRLRKSGEGVVFFTNNSGPTVTEQMAQLKNAGVTASRAEMLTSAQSAAWSLNPGARAAVVGGAGVVEALEERGIEIVPATAEPDAMVVGRTTEITFRGLAEAATAIRNGARFVATNNDATLPTPHGPLPGAGAIVAFVRVASGVEPTVTGKPSSVAADMVAARVGPISVVVGDRADTDGLFARATKAKFFLVLSGVTNKADLPVEPRPDLVGASLAEVVSRALGTGGS